VYHMKRAGLHEISVFVSQRQYQTTVNDSLSVVVLDRVSGLRLTTQQPHAELLTDSDGSQFTDPVLFVARYQLCFLLVL